MVSLPYTMQDTLNFPKKTLLPNSFVLHRNFKAFQFSDKLKPVRQSPFENLNEPTDLTYEPSRHIRKTFYSHRNQLISSCPINIFSFTTNKILLALMIPIHQARFKNSYMRQKTNRMKLFLMTIHNVIWMMREQICFTMNNVNL